MDGNGLVDYSSNAASHRPSLAGARNIFLRPMSKFSVKYLFSHDSAIPTLDLPSAYRPERPPLFLRPYRSLRATRTLFPRVESDKDDDQIYPTFFPPRIGTGRGLRILEISTNHFYPGVDLPRIANVKLTV